VIFKKYYSAKEQRYLSYEEILKSPMIDWFRANDFEKAGVTLEENSPREILATVQEMHSRIKGTYHISTEITQQYDKIQAVRRDVHESRKLKTDIQFPFLPAYLFDLTIGAEFLKENPYFLGENVHANITQ